MSNTENINAWFDQLDATVNQVIPNIIAETATEHFKERFLQKNWEGRAWAKYNPNNKKNRKEPSAGSLMMRSNNLFSSIRPGLVEPHLVVINAGGKKVAYARVHNEGLRVTASQYVRPHTNKNFMGTGKTQQIKAHSRQLDFKMPKRQFIGRSAFLNKKIHDRLSMIFKK